MTNVLLVEDNSIDARLMHRMFHELVDWPTEVTWVDDGQKALWFLQSLENGGVEDPPHLVLLDVNLPKYDGIQVLKAFRDSAMVWDLPVFLYSSSSVKDLVEIAEKHDLRADGYFEKPFGLDGYQEIGLQIKLYLEKSTRGIARLASAISEARTADGLERTKSAHP